MSPSPARRAPAAEPPPLTSSLQAGLCQLLEAYDYARDLEKDPWEFAVEINGLRSVGLTNNHLRWLLCKGYLLHATEKIMGGRGKRLFRRTGRLALSDRSCFVLTDLGMGLVRATSAPPTAACPANVLEMAQNNPPVPTDVPRWDNAQHTLYWRRQPVKHFKREAPAQEA